MLPFGQDKGSIMKLIEKVFNPIAECLAIMAFGLLKIFPLLSIPRKKKLPATSG